MMLIHREKNYLSKKSYLFISLFFFYIKIIFFSSFFNFIANFCVRREKTVFFVGKVSFYMLEKRLVKGI